MKSIEIITRKDIDALIKEKIAYEVRPFWEKIYKLENRIRDLEKIMQNNVEQLNKLKEMFLANKERR